MKKTELVFILDRSGSMSGLEEDTIGGYNAMLLKQAKQEGQARVTTILFDDLYEVVHDRKSIHDIKLLTSKEYFVRGTTALLDAVGKTLNKIIAARKAVEIQEWEDKVIFVIITDGMENASREFDYEQIKARIDKQKEESNWEFLFLGANMDAVATASQFGIKSDRAVSYHADEEGIQLNYQVLNNFVSKARMGHEIKEDWKSDIEDDFNKRRND